MNFLSLLILFGPMGLIAQPSSIELNNTTFSSDKTFTASMNITLGPNITVGPGATPGEEINITLGSPTIYGIGNIHVVKGSNVFIINKLLPSSIPNSLEKFSFEVAQNNPNPFSDITHIPFELTKPAQVEIEVYSLVGELVASVYKGYKMPGKHTVAWNRNNSNQGMVAAGTYLYKVKVDDKVIMKKMVLTP